MSVKSIIGTYGYITDNMMNAPKNPVSYEGMNKECYDLWIAANKSEYSRVLNELKEKITHVTYKTFQEKLKITVESFKATFPQKSPCVAFVQPGKSQKWVTEIAIKMGLKASAYVCIGEEGANGLSFSLENISSKDKRFHHCVIVDDGSYSGNQMANNISGAYRILKAKFAIEPTFDVLIPYITKAASDRINSLKAKGIRVNLHTAVEMPSVKQAISTTSMDRTLEVLWPSSIKTKQLELAHSTALYWFDHKVPNSMSFPDVLAKGRVTQPKETSQKDKDIAFIPNVHPPYKEPLEIKTPEKVNL